MEYLVQIIERASYNSYLCISLISVTSRILDDSHRGKTSLGNKMTLSTAFNRPLLRTWAEELPI